MGELKQSIQMTSQRVEYWDGRWKNNQSPWHKNEKNDFLVNHFSHIIKYKNPARILVAIYQEDREKYAELIKNLLAEDFSYLVATMVYDQSQFPGPPRSVPVEEIKTLFGDKCDIQVLEEVNRNADPTSSYSPKVRWNIDECYETIVLLSRKNPTQ